MALTTCPNRTVIELKPLAIILGKCRVMTSTQTSVMVAHREQLINRLNGSAHLVRCLGLNIHVLFLHLLDVWAHWGWVNQVVFYVQLHGELDSWLVLLFPHCAFLLESLQVQDQDLRRLINAKFLVSLLVLLAEWTIPLIAHLQLLDFPEMVETLLEGNCYWVRLLGLWFLHFLFKTFQPFKVKFLQWGQCLESNIQFDISWWTFFDKIGNVSLIRNLSLRFVSELQTMISFL